MRIATFNLESLDDGPKVEPRLAERLPILRPQLARLAADVICLQEINAQGPKHRRRRLAALDRLLEGTEYAGFARAHTRRESRDAPLDLHNLVILSRWPILEQRQIRNDLVPPPEWRFLSAHPAAKRRLELVWDRPALYVALDIGGGRKLHVINLHLRAPLASFIPGQKLAPFAWKTAGGWAEGFFLAAIKRAGQAFEVRLFVERLFDADPEALIVVCGDCNAEVREMPLRLLRADVDDTGNPGLVGRRLVPIGRTAPQARRFTVLHAGYPAMLDHLLVSPALLGWFRDIEILNEGLQDETAGAAVSPGSFHAPVVASFIAPGRQGAASTAAPEAGTDPPGSTDAAAGRKPRISETFD